MKILNTMNNKNILKLVLFCLVALSAGTAQGQQESQFTQFMYNKLYLNPAYSGARGMASLTAIYRNQWMGFDGAPISKLVSFNTPLLGERVGFGLTVSNHTMGLMNSWYGNMAYSYLLRLTEHTAIRFGLQGTIRYLGLDFADPEVIIRQSGDPSLSQNMEDKYTGNFGMGVYFTYKQFYLGASVPHFFPNEITLNKFNTIVAQEYAHYYAMAGALLRISDKMHFKPAALFKYVENAPADLDLNLSLVFDLRFTAGLSYRMGGNGAGESIDLLALYQYNNIALGIAYDVNISDLSDYNSGSIEALLRYDFFKAQADIANPRFFY